MIERLTAPTTKTLKMDYYQPVRDQYIQKQMYPKEYRKDFFPAKVKLEDANRFSSIANEFCSVKVHLQTSLYMILFPQL